MGLFCQFLQGGLIGLAAVTVGLTSEAAQHLEVSIFIDAFSLYLTISSFGAMISDNSPVGREVGEK